MDPTATLARYQDAAARSDWSEAEDAAEALALWIARGGCFPRQWGQISHPNGRKLARFLWSDASRRAEQAEFEAAMADYQPEMV